MIKQELYDAMVAACTAVRINPPRREPPAGRWVQVDTYERNGKGDGRILIFDDQQGGICWNHQTQQRQQFSVREGGPVEQGARPRRDPEKERRRQEEQRAIERICTDIVRTCRHEPHPYLARKGFPDERGLVHDDPRSCFPATSFGELLAKALPEVDGPLLIVPGRIDGEFYARQSGRVWTMPPVPGDFNDYHMEHGLRAVALLLREAMG